MIPEAVLDFEDTIPSPAAVLDSQALLLAERDRGVNMWLLFGVLALIAIGTVEIYSASAVYAARKGSSTFFLTRQIAYLGLGLGAMTWAARTDYRWLRRWAYPLLAVASRCSRGAGRGPRVNGARRWFHFGPLSFQPVELAKLALVIYLAYSLARRPEKVSTFTVGFLPHLAVCGLMMGLVLKQPDLGTSLILGATTLRAALRRRRQALATSSSRSSRGAGRVPGDRRHAVAAAAHPRVPRPVAVPPATSATRSPSRSSRSARAASPASASATASRSSSTCPRRTPTSSCRNIGEELGFMGLRAVLALFGVLVWRGARAASGARDAFGTYLAFGLTSISRCRRWSTPAWSSARCRPRASRCPS